MPPQGTFKHLQASLAQSFVGVIAPFPWVLVRMRFVCVLQETLVDMGFDFNILLMWFLLSHCGFSFVFGHVAHCTLFPHFWWKCKLRNYFTIFLFMCKWKWWKMATDSWPWCWRKSRFGGIMANCIRLLLLGNESTVLIACPAIWQLIKLHFKTLFF